MSNKTSKIQILRFLVQLLFMSGLLFSLHYLPGSKDVRSWLTPLILLVGVFFCGWVCPFGSAQEWLGRLGRLLHLPQLRIPQHLQRYLQLSRYVFYLVLTMGITLELLQGPKHFSMLMRNQMLTLAAGIVLFFLLLSLFIDRPFCNYFCTGGARMGLLSVLRIFGIRRNTEQCKQCGQCSKACPMNIDVAHTDFVRHPNCIGCMRCVSSCPKSHLKYGLMPSSRKQK